MPRVVVMGGSLGGLTAALVLRDVGCEVEVYERAKEPLESAGAGIVLHPVTVRYLTENDVLDVEEVSADARWVRYLDEAGEPVHQRPCDYRFTSYHVIYQGLLGCLDPGRYHLGEPVVDLGQEGDEVVVGLGSGGSDRCGLLVCADGIRSTARRILLSEVEPEYAGYVGWRGTVSETDLTDRTFELLHEAITYHVMPNSHILAYPIPNREGSLEPGRRLTNWVWYRNVPPAELDDLLTTPDGERRELSLRPGQVREGHVRELAGAAEEDLPAPLQEMVRRTEEPFVQVVVDVAVPRMAFGRICLVGDAAFALRPHAAAGTAKAAEDAWQLAGALEAAGGDVVEALRRWEPGQLQLARSVLARTREAGNRSQFDNTWEVGDPLPFGLYRVGDSSMSGGGDAP